MFREMKCCFVSTKFDDEETEQMRKSKKIDQMLAKDKRMIRKQIRLLLLGAGESGKSTFLKQMMIIHGHQFEIEVLKEYKLTIYQNVIKGMKVLIDARNKLGIPWEDDSNWKIAEHVFSIDNNVILNYDKFEEYASAIKILWNDSGIKYAFERRAEFQLSDGVVHFFDNIDKIAAKDYIPSNQDILHARKATKGITEYVVNINNVPFKFVDVGGQRPQRQKWFQCFEGVTSILFLVSSTEYDQVLLEDRETNRMGESLDIFNNIANSKCFVDVSIILFLNKTDLLKEKLIRASQQQKTQNSQSKISTQMTDEVPHTIDYYFPEFTGDSLNLEDVQAFMIEMFDSVRRDRQKQMYHHFTTAIDTENIKYVFNAVRNTILQKNITQLMLQ